MTPSQTATLIDGKAASKACLDALKDTLGRLPQDARRPKLVVVLVGDDPASQVYVNKKAKVARDIGMASAVLTFAKDAGQAELEATLQELNQDPEVDGILIQLPLPRHLDSDRLLSLIDPGKDVDGLHPANLGRLLAGQPMDALPCTPGGMMRLLAEYGISPAGKHAVIVGRSNIVGKPMALLLLQANATVTICHSKTQNLSALCQSADIVVAAVGIPRLITGQDLKPGAVVLDVGINRLADGTLAGDVDFESASAVAGFITPVPGGVGPMTIATLMENTLRLYHKHVS